MMHCKTCGSTVQPDLTACAVCNQSFVRAVVLEGAVGSMTAAIATNVGRALLQTVIGDESRFAAAEQFRLERPGGGDWRLVPAAEVPNPTFINGAAVPTSGVTLKDGDEVSLMGKVGRMRVRIVRED